MNIQKLSLKNYSSFRIGGVGDLVVVKSEEELVEAVEYAAAEGRRVHIIGEGTNSVFGDNLSNYLFIKNEILGVETKTTDSQTVRQSDSLMSDVRMSLKAASGENWDDIVKLAVKESLWGIENLSYIPGTVGASPVQNIGAYGMELKDTLVSVRVYDTKGKIFKELKNEECNFGYRDSIFKHEVGRYIIVSVTLSLSKTQHPILTYKPLDILKEKENLTLDDIRNAVIKVRTDKLPDYNLYPNTGSFFKNTVITLLQGKALQEKYPNIILHEQDGGYKVPSAWLIEHVAHMKGVRTGNIGTWPAQPLVLVNYSEGTFDELNTFASSIIEKIKQETGIVLEREVNFIT